MSIDIPYGILFWGFHFLIWLSVLLTTFLLATYQQSGQNILLRSQCCVMLVTFFMIELGPLLYGKEPYLYDSFSEFCILQAITLNYCFVSIQAHSASMMINSCLLALGWKFGKRDLLMDSTMFFLGVSYGIPLIPTVILGFNIPDASQHTTFPFFAYVPASLQTACTTIWYFLFAVPGALATLYLMYKTIMVRRKTLEMTSYSQISLLQMIRLFVAMSVYIMLSLGSSIPLLFVDESKWTLPENFLASSALKSPWTNPQLCHPDANTDDRFLYFYRTRCPGPLSYFPSLIGIGIFLMYGFGSPVKSALRQVRVLTDRLLRLPKRRMSKVSFNDAASEYEVNTSNLARIQESEEDIDNNRHNRRRTAE